MTLNPIKINTGQIDKLLAKGFINLGNKQKLILETNSYEKSSVKELFFYKEWYDKTLKSKTYRIWQKYCRIRECIKQMNIKGLYSEIKSIIPIKTRQKIKNKILAIIPILEYRKLPADVQKDFDNYSKTRKENSFDLINFSIIAWNYRFQRPQHLAQINGQKGNRVFYIKNEFLPTKNKKTYAPFRIKKVSENVFEVILSASENLFIYNDKPKPKDIDRIIASLKYLIQQANIINPVAKIDHPFWGHIIEELKMPVIYDCMDNHQGFVENSKDLVDSENKLFEKSDITLVSSHYLQKIAEKNRAKNITLVPNACDYQHFAKITKTIPKDIVSIPGPIIGYYGAVADWFDISILEDLAKNHPKKSIVLIGHVTNNKVISLSKKYKNIYLLGEKSYQELPNYLSQFDVCIIPFIINELIKATHPVKIYEYLAAGKPVVTTKLPEIIDLEKDIFYTSAKDFSKQIDLALKVKNKNISTRQQIAKNNTWDKRSDQLLNTISTILFPKVSIIILSYNHPDLMKLTIESVLHRSFYPNIEIIIVDNASNSETVNLLKKYSHLKNVKIIFNKTNYGFAKGNNIGLKKSTGDYIILLNNDVIVTPGWISRLLFYIKKDKVGLVGPVTNNIGNEAKIDIHYDFNDTNDLEKNALNYTSKHWGDVMELKNIAAFCWIMSRKTYQQLGGLDEDFGRGMFEDDDYCRRIRKNNQKILISDDVFIHHFGGASFKQIQSTEYQKLFNDNKKIFEKKWGKWQPHQYRK